MKTNRPPLDFDLIKAAAVGNYVRTIFPAVGIQLRTPANKHQPCPLCGGNDRFRCDDKRGEGTWICNQCGAGNGFMLVQRYTNSDVYDTNKLIAQALGIDGKQQVTDEKRAAWKSQQAEVEAKEKEAKRQARKAAAEQAQQLWQSAKPADDSHSYLQRKQVSALGIRCDSNGNLLIPMYYYNQQTGDTTLVNVQSISADGNKLFIKGGLVKGAYSLIGSPQMLELSKVILLCEGYATAASIFDAMSYGYPIFVCFNANNLIAVAPIIRAQYPNHRIIICADDDTKTAIKLRDDDIAKGKTPKPLIEYNAGVRDANKAAALVGGEVVIPDFSNVKEVAA